MLSQVDFDAFNDSELQELLVTQKEALEALTLENNLFESYLSRQQEPTQAQAQTLELEDKTTKDKVKKRKEKTIVETIQLTINQKCEVATREIEEVRDELEKDKSEWGKIIDNLKAETEEVDIRIAEVKKALFEFKRDILSTAVNNRTGKVVAERVQRYYEDRIRSKETIIEKVRLKNATLKVQKGKLQSQLKQKEEMGEVLHAIDFDQLQIENKQYQTRIEERNTQLLKLKKSAGNTVQILNVYKTKLSQLTRESDKIMVEIASRQDLLKRLKSERENVARENEKATEALMSLERQVVEFRVPNVMDYVDVKANEWELKKVHSSWLRKCEITQMQEKRVKGIWKAMLQSSAPKQA